MDVGSHSSSGPYEDYLCDRASAYEQPILGTFELTPVCNMSCNMCYVRMKKSQVDSLGGLQPEEFWINLAKEAMDNGLLFLLLTGGEPLIYPNFRSLFTKLQSMGLFITMNTNGTLIDEDMAKFFHDHMLRRLNITIYGKDNETYERLCHNPQGFTQLERAIHYLKKYDVPVRLNCSITSQNYEQLDDFYRIAEEWEVPIEISYFMFPPNRREDKEHFEQYRMTAEQTAKIAYAIHTHNYSKEQKKEYAKAKLEHMEEYKNDKELKGGFYCRAGNSSFWINWQGKMVPCGIMNGPVHDICTDGFKKCWDDVLVDVKKIKLSEKCFRCEKHEICPHCAAVEIAECGEFGISPDYPCQIADFYKDLLLKELEQ
ncbi:MAG: radical SAM protein [Eubacteriales bacterium]|nr:radical SAM protein [Eubacteriales bacterium]